MSKGKPSNPNGKFLLPSPEFADTNTGDRFKDVRRYFQDVVVAFGDDRQKIAEELTNFIYIYSDQYHWFNNNKRIKQAIRDDRKDWYRSVIDMAIKFRAIQKNQRGD
tara:strand:- start:319 stop:639 length:321 start_codon:yes stop_codon:yes gene_type:complete